MKKLFKNTGYFVGVFWNESARIWSVGGDSNKRIYHIEINSPIKIKRFEQLKQMAFKSETYNPIKIKQLKNNGILPIDFTAGQEIPRDALNMSDEELSLGVIEFHKRFG